MSRKALKFISFVVCLAMLGTLVLSGCGTKKQENAGGPAAGTGATVPEQAKVTGKLKVAVVQFPTVDTVNPATGVLQKGMKVLFDQFTKQNPGITVEEPIPLTGDPTQIVQKLTTLLLSNEVDVFYQSGYEQYAMGLVLNLKDLIAKKDPKYWENYMPGAMEGERISISPDHIMGLPGHISAPTLAYDKKIFDDWGVAPLSKTPTAEEIMEKAAKLTGKNPKTGKQTYGIYIEGKGQCTYVLDELFGFPVGVFDRMNYAKGEVKVNTPENKAKLEKFISLLKYCPPGAALGQGNEKWASEDNDIAIHMRAGAGSAEKLKTNKLYDRFIYTNGMKDKEGRVSYNSPMSWCIAKSTKYVDAAWEFAKYCSGYEGQKFIFENYGDLPSILKKDFIENSTDPFVKNVTMPLSIAVQGKPRYPFFPPFFLKSFRPWLNGVMARTFDGGKIDLDKELLEQQKEAEKWVSEQKPLEIK